MPSEFRDALNEANRIRLMAFEQNDPQLHALASATLALAEARALRRAAETKTRAAELGIRVIR